MESKVTVISGKWKKLNAQIVSINPQNNSESKQKYVAIDDNSILLVPLDKFMLAKIFNFPTINDKIFNTIVFNAIVLFVKLNGKKKILVTGSNESGSALFGKEGDSALFGKEGLAIADMKNNLFSSEYTLIVEKSITIMSLDIDDDQTGDNDYFLTPIARKFFARNLDLQSYKNIDTIDTIDILANNVELYSKFNIWGLAFDIASIKEGEMVTTQFDKIQIVSDKLNPGQALLLRIQ